MVPKVKHMGGTAERHDLRTTSSLPLALLADGWIAFADGLPPVRPAVRTRPALADVLLDPHAEGPDELYYMYRGVGFPGDAAAFAAEGVRYDVTVLRPGTLGREYVKTYGHYHPLAPAQALAYPEVYEVLAGRGHFLLQKPGAPPHRPPGGTAGRPDAACGRAVTDVILVEAGPGEKVLIPPGYGHVTINPADGWLVIGNLVAVEFDALYEPYRRARGAAYYEVAGEGFRPNPRYGSVPPLRRLPPTAHPALGLQTGVPLYRAFLEAPGRFRFLRDPSALPAPPP